MALLNDPELAADYARVHRSFKQLAAEIAQLPLDDAQAHALNVTVEHEQNLYDAHRRSATACRASTRRRSASASTR